jgi:hypothetical protein
MKVGTYLGEEKPARMEDFCRVNPDLGEGNSAEVFIYQINQDINLMRLSFVFNWGRYGGLRVSGSRFLPIWMTLLCVGYRPFDR